MIFRPLLGFLAIGLALPVLACGGDDDSGGTAAAASPRPAGSAATSAPVGGGGPSPTTASSQPSTSGDGGSVTVDGTKIGIDQVRRCEPFFKGADDLDLTGIGSGVTVFVNVNHPVAGSGFTMFEMSLQGTKAGGVFSGTANSVDGKAWTDEDSKPIDGAPFTRSDDRISGELMLSDARGGASTRTVAVDIEIPDKITAC